MDLNIHLTKHSDRWLLNAVEPAVWHTLSVWGLILSKGTKFSPDILKNSILSGPDNRSTFQKQLSLFLQASAQQTP